MEEARVNSLISFATLRFDGERFDEHALDVECLGELRAYRDLVLACADAIWHRENPDRQRLDRGFEARFALRLTDIGDGSAVATLKRVVPKAELDFVSNARDEFDEAAGLIDGAIAAAAGDRLLPAEFPSDVVPLFASFGRSLREGESIFLKSRTSAAEAPYTTGVRDRLAKWVTQLYEDNVDLVGEVTASNVRSGAFELTLEVGGVRVAGKFSPEQEATVLEALRDHRKLRLRVKGVGEFSTHDKLLKRLLSVDQVTFTGDAECEYDTTATPIWETLVALGDSIPREAWDELPTDLSTRVDEILYGRGDDDR